MCARPSPSPENTTSCASGRRTRFLNRPICARNTFPPGRTSRASRSAYRTLQAELQSGDQLDLRGLVKTPVPDSVISGLENLERQQQVARNEDQKKKSRGHQAAGRPVLHSE